MVALELVVALARGELALVHLRRGGAAESPSRHSVHFAWRTTNGTMKYMERPCVTLRPMASCASILPSSNRAHQASRLP